MAGKRCYKLHVAAMLVAALAHHSGTVLAAGRDLQQLGRWLGRWRDGCQATECKPNEPSIEFCNTSKLPQMIVQGAGKKILGEYQWNGLLPCKNGMDRGANSTCCFLRKILFDVKAFSPSIWPGCYCNHIYVKDYGPRAAQTSVHTTITYQDFINDLQSCGIPFAGGTGASDCSIYYSDFEKQEDDPVATAADQPGEG